MTANDYYGTMVVCVWFDSVNQKHEGRFAPEALEIVKDDHPELRKCIHEISGDSETKEPKDGD